MEKYEDDWDLFKNSMEQTSVNLMGKIDYLFPVEINMYNVLKPLFAEFSNISFLHHQCISSKNINAIDLLLFQWHSHIDKLVTANDEQRM
jgi:hypothetical protein